MHSKLALPLRLLIPTIVIGLVGNAGGQTQHEFAGQQALTCPENVKSASPKAAGSGAQSFDYSLLQKKHQRLVSQLQITADAYATQRAALDKEPPHFGRLTSQQRKLATRAAAHDADRYAVSEPGFRDEDAAEQGYYRGATGEPELETPDTNPRVLSTALGSHVQAPLQMQNPGATTGVQTGSGPVFAATTGSRRPTARRSRPSRSAAYRVQGSFVPVRGSCR